ncbi:MAG: phosphotransferase [Anaerolineae bacterium]|nr:phosphotransferase [Anaerolineae bacterium]
MSVFHSFTQSQQQERLTGAAHRALKQYGLSNARIEAVSSVNNAVFKCMMGEQIYALRLHRAGYSRADWIRSEMEWLQAIRRETPLQVPRPISTAAGDLLTTVPVDDLEEAVICTLLGWIEGAFFTPNNMRLEQVRAAGEFLARLHNFAFVPPPDFVRPRLDADGLFGASAQYDPGDGAGIFSAAQKAVFADVEIRVRGVMESLGQSPEQFGLIHGDFIAKNMLFNQQGVGAIDFDNCGWGYYLYDLAPALLQFSIEPRYPELRKAFLEGYGAVRSLSDTDSHALEGFLAARQVASCRWLAGNLHNPDVRARAPELIAKRTDELRRFLETGQMFTHQQFL